MAPQRGGGGGRKKCFHLNTHSDYKMYHTKGRNWAKRYVKKFGLNKLTDTQTHPDGRSDQSEDSDPI